MDKSKCFEQLRLMAHCNRPPSGIANIYHSVTNKMVRDLVRKGVPQDKAVSAIADYDQAYIERITTGSWPSAIFQKTQDNFN